MKVERTFVFVDLSGFTKYTADNGDSAAGNILTKCLMIYCKMAISGGLCVA